MEMGGTHGYLICFDCVKDHKQGMAVERGDLDRQYIVGEQGRNRKSEANTQFFLTYQQHFGKLVALWGGSQGVGCVPFLPPLEAVLLGWRSRNASTRR